MESSGMVWWFHPEVQGVHLLFESFVLDNGLKLFLAYIFIVAMCWTERGISFYLDYRSRRQGWKDILLRTGLYGVATTLRLWYMLITMYFNIGLFIVVVVALTSGQLAVEYFKAYNVPSSGTRRIYDENGYAQPSKQQRFSNEEEQQLFSVTDDAFELSRNSYDERTPSRLPRVTTRFSSTTTNIYRPVAAVIVKRGPCTVNEPNDNNLHSLDRKSSEPVYLIVKKPRKDHAWGFPQGGIDPGESVAEAALRELSEECGNDIKVRLIDTISPSCVYQYRFPDEFIRKSKRRFTGAKVEFMRAEWLTGQCSPDNHEIVDFAWLTVDELETYIEDKDYKHAIFNALKQ